MRKSSYNFLFFNFHRIFFFKIFEFQIPLIPENSEKSTKEIENPIEDTSQPEKARLATGLSSKNHEFCIKIEFEFFVVKLF